jgi:hypothetical protein
LGKGDVVQAEVLGMAAKVRAKLSRELADKAGQLLGEFKAGRAQAFAHLG